MKILTKIKKHIINSQLKLKIKNSCSLLKVYEFIIFTLIHIFLRWPPGPGSALRF